MPAASLARNNLSQALLEAVARADVAPLECEGVRLSQAGFPHHIAMRHAAWKGDIPAPGERVLVATGRGNDVWMDIVSIWALGATAVPLEPSAEPRQLQAVLDTARPIRRIGDFQALDGPAEAPQPLPMVSGDAGEEHPAPEVTPVAPEREAMVLFTSGSTGMPKGVPLTHGALLGNARSTASVIGLHEAQRLFMPVPFRFISAISHFLVTILSGATLIGTERKLIQADLVDRLIECNADAFGGAPVQARWIAQSGERIGSRLRWLMSSGDHLPTAVISELRAALPDLAIHTVYGLTELAGRFCALPPQQLDALAGSVGKAIAGFNVSIVTADGRRAVAGEDGEVWAGGAFVFTGYLNAPDINRRCLGPLGFNTGDIGHKDEDGWLYLTGRSDDVFKSAGLKVSTVEVAAALMDIGMFSDVAVVPWDAPGLGLVPHACVVMKPEIGFQKGRVIRALRDRLPAHCIPRHYLEMGEIPRTGSGKVRRGVLKELLKSQ